MKTKLLYACLLFLILVSVIGILKRELIEQELLIVKVEYSGGLCRGWMSVSPCHSSRVMYRFNNSSIRELVEQTNFEEMHKSKFTELCPSAIDGMSATYTFYTSHGIEKINDCETKIDKGSLLFQAIR